MSKKVLIGVLAGVVVAGAIAAYYFLVLSPEKVKEQQAVKEQSTPKVVQEEKLVIPDTKEVVQNEGRVVTEGTYDTPLVPKNEGEQVVVSKAVLTVKGAYDLGAPKATAWAADAKLIFIKSLGAITLDGKSSQWQIVFGSAVKKKGYEVIVQESSIASNKEIATVEYGYALPENWYDSGDAMASLNLPQFEGATASSINFFYNNDGKRWSYAIATSRGTTAMPVK